MLVKSSVPGFLPWQEDHLCKAEVEPTKGAPRSVGGTVALKCYCFDFSTALDSFISGWGLGFKPR